MNEADYWTSLEYRLSREFSGMADRRFQYFWCDGFIPSQYFLEDARPRITGWAWICNGHRQAKWEYVLLLPHKFRSREEIDWLSLYPPDHVTRWLAIDCDRRRIEIEPAVAVPDLDGRS